MIDTKTSGDIVVGIVSRNLIWNTTIILFTKFKPYSKWFQRAQLEMYQRINDIEHSRILINN